MNQSIIKLVQLASKKFINKNNSAAKKAFDQLTTLVFTNKIENAEFLIKQINKDLKTDKLVVYDFGYDLNGKITSICIRAADDLFDQRNLSA